MSVPAVGSPEKVNSRTASMAAISTAVWQRSIISWTFSGARVEIGIRVGFSVNVRVGKGGLIEIVQTGGGYVGVNN